MHFFMIQDSRTDAAPLCVQIETMENLDDDPDELLFQVIVEDDPDAREEVFDTYADAVDGILSLWQAPMYTVTLHKA